MLLAAYCVVEVSVCLMVSAFIVTRSRGRINSLNLINICEHSWMVGIKEGINHAGILVLLMNIEVFWFRMIGMVSILAIAIITTVNKGSMVYHIGFGVKEGMNVRKDFIIRCWIPINIRGHHEISMRCYFVGSSRSSLKVRKAFADSKGKLIALHEYAVRTSLVSEETCQ
jgi:hypothetical protein